MVITKKFSLLIIALLLTACTHENAPKAESITKTYNTQPVVKLVEPPENALLLEWRSDNMDRGDHDYETAAHQRLVVDLDYSKVQRGDIVYFSTPEFTNKNPDATILDFQISRVVGLPGEYIEIKDGQVYIDDRKLDYFYSKALKTGLDEKRYFERSNEDRGWREYFSTDMKSQKTPRNAVFVLGDNWWRSLDSRDFGTVPIENVEGEVLGYKK